jgi:hypothetical protein
MRAELRGLDRASEQNENDWIENEGRNIQEQLMEQEVYCIWTIYVHSTYIEHLMEQEVCTD